jgi:hypothetical protein
MSKSNLGIAIGAALMAWGGSSITSALGFVGWRQVNVALFAIGIVILAQAPFASMNARMRRLEDVLKHKDANSSSALGNTR